MRILPVGLKISLLSVVPGKEKFVADKMKRAIALKTRTNPLAILKLFGKYDLCLIYKTRDFLSGPSKAGSIDGIRGGNQIFAFPWHPHGKDHFLKPNPQLTVWGLLFFRINESLAKEYGATIEEFITEVWQSSRQPGVELDILGTTGWAELVFIIRGKRFKPVTDCLLKISQEVVNIHSGKAVKKDLFSAKTFTILGVDFRCVRTNNFSRITKSFEEDFVVGESVYPSVAVTCPPGDMKNVYEYARSHLGDGSTTFGSRDFLFVPSKCRTWGQVIANVLKMRKELTDSIYTTAIEVLSPGPTSVEKLPSFPLKRKSRHGITVNDSLLKAFERWGPDFENRLLNLYFGISNLIQDPLTGDCFEDLRKMAASRLPELLKDKEMDPDATDDQSIVWEIVEALAYGADERANGAFLAIEHVENRFSPTKGGIQRILRAAKLVADQILKRIGIQYQGFVVAGFRNKGFYSHGEIINLPFQYLFHPEEWWGLFHEIGHVALWDPDFNDLLNNDTILSLLDDLADEGDKSKRDEWSNLFLEIGADSFDLFFCHNSDIDTYLSNIWPYVTRWVPKIQSRHFVRYFCMFQYWKHILKKREERFPNRIDSQAEMMSFRNLLTRLRLFAPGLPSYNDEAIDIFEKTLAVIEVCHGAYMKRVEMVSKKPKHSASVRAAVKAILGGEIYRAETIDQADRFILALKKQNKSLSLASRIAAILSLWHTATVLDHDRDIT